MIELEDTSPAEEEIKKELKLKTDYNQIVVAIVGSIAQSFWYISDYLVIPDDRYSLLIGRLLVVAIPILVCVFRKRLNVSASFCLFTAALAISFLIAWIINTAPYDVFQTYVIGYIILLLGMGTLASWERRFSIAFMTLSCTANAILYLSLCEIPADRYFAEGVVPIFTIAVIALLMIENRRNIQIKEIKSRLELDRSKRLLVAQKEKLNAELDSFVYSVSHDLRSPLLSVKGIISLLRESKTQDAAADGYLKLAESSINRLDNTIQDILEYSRNSRMDIKIEAFDIKQVVREVFDDLQYLSENPIRFEIDVLGDQLIYSDKTRLTTIIKNLAANATKYRKLDSDDCLVRFELEEQNELLVLRIIDNGIGIPPAEKENVFKMFYRVSTDRMGTGLGLFIVQEIANKLDGVVKIDSSIGQGTTVEISLPNHRLN